MSLINVVLVVLYVFLFVKAVILPCSSALECFKPTDVSKWFRSSAQLLLSDQQLGTSLGFVGGV